MQTTVLEYAREPQAASVWRSLRRWALGAGFVIVGAAAGGIVGYGLTPTHFRAVALHSLDTPPGTSIPAAQQTHATLMKSPAVLDAALADLQSQGHQLPAGAAGRQFLDDHLEVEIIPHTRFIGVRFRAHDHRLASEGAAAVITAAEPVSANTVRLGPTPTVGVGTYRSPVGAVIGALIGLAGAVFVVMRWRARCKLGDACQTK